MSTFLFDDIIFGPVKSRRLGASLGVNLLPVNGKFCNFNCIYCECGWSSGSVSINKLPKRQEIRERLEGVLQAITANHTALDKITFAGNGEPTIHPEFPGIVEDIIQIRDRYVPQVKIAVLSNATQLDKPEIFHALEQVDMNILKLDSANEATVRLINQPPAGYSIDRVIDGMIRFNGRFILQTLFVQGEAGGIFINNATPEEVNNWLSVVQQIKPQMVMIYTIARDTPLQTLQKVEAKTLDQIADEVRKLGFAVQVSY